MGKGAELVVLICNRSSFWRTKRNKINIYEGTKTEKEDTWQGTCCLRLKPYAAILLAATSSAASSTSEAIVKYSPSMGPSNQLLFRSFFMANFSLPLFVYDDPKTVKVAFSKSWKLIFLRILLSCTSFFLYFIALRRIPIAEASLLQSTWTIVVTILARIILKEHIDRYKLASVVITFCGLCSLSRLPNIIFSSALDDKHRSLDYWLGFAAALGCTLTFSLEALVLRKLRHVKDTTLLCSQSILMVLVFLALSSSQGTLDFPRCGIEGMLMVCHGIFGTIAQPLRTLCFKLEDASVVAVLTTSSRIMFNILFQTLFFRDALDAYSITGACFIFISLLICFLKKRNVNK